MLSKCKDSLEEYLSLRDLGKSFSFRYVGISLGIHSVDGGTDLP